MSTTQALLTAEQFAEMSFDVPVELVRGEIAEMTRPDMRHGQVCGNVAFELKNWARTLDRAGCVACNDSGVITEHDPDTVRGPDVMYVSADRLPGGMIPRGFADLVPNLCVEVLSPSDRWREVHRKIDEYLTRGVLEVWIVDSEKRTVQVFRADEPPTTYPADQELVSQILSGFAAPVARLFEGL